MISVLDRGVRRCPTQGRTNFRQVNNRVPVHEWRRLVPIRDDTTAEGPNTATRSCLAGTVPWPDVRRAYNVRSTIWLSVALTTSTDRRAAVKAKGTRAALLILGTLVLSACSSGSPGSGSPSTTNGIGSLDGRAILDQAYANAQAQASVAVSGNGHCESKAFAVNMKLAKNGHATGDVTIGPDKITLIASGDDLYIKAPGTFWAANATSASKAATVGDKWVRSRNVHDSLCLRALTSYSAFLTNFLDLSGTVSKVGPGSVLGKPAVVVQVPQATVFVSAVGTPLPVRVDSTAPQQDGGLQDGMSFGGWNSPVSVSVPSPQDVVDAAVLTGR